jgi:hypothetical protein
VVCIFITRLHKQIHVYPLGGLRIGEAGQDEECGKKINHKIPFIHDMSPVVG